MSVVSCARIPTLRAPIAVIAFGGWGDGAEAWTIALNTLAAQWQCQEFASIDPDEFYDFTQVRPRVHFTEDMGRDIDWPSSTFSFRKRPKAKNDVVTFTAAEPHLRWKRYSDGIIDFFERLNVSLLVSMGSVLADVPHTRPVQLTGFASDNDLRDKLRASGADLSSYQGPTGMLGVIHAIASKRGIPALSLWGAAPHYISAAANPTVALAMLEGLATTLDWSLDLGGFRNGAKEFQSEVDAIIQANPDATAYVAARTSGR